MATRRVALNCCNSLYFPSLNLSTISNKYIIAGIADSFIPYSYANTLKSHNIPFWGWEQYLSHLLASNGLASALSYLEQDIKETASINNLMRAHVYRQLLRQNYAVESHYIFELIIRVLYVNSIQFLKASQADLLLSMHPPHHVGDYLLACAAMKMGIQALLVEKDPYLSRMICQDSDWVFIRDMQTGNIINSTLRTSEAFMKQVRAYYIRESASEIIYASSGKESLKNEVLSNKKYCLSNLESPQVIAQLDYIAECKRMTRKYTAKYSSRQERYILLCLHVEPEAILSPMGYKYMDQLLFASSLADWCAFYNIKVIIREHPCFLNLSSASLESNEHLIARHLRPRSRMFYAELANLPCVAGFDNESSFRDLLKMECVKGVASVGGSTLIQSLQNGKIAIHGAPLWFDSHKNCCHVDDRKWGRSHTFKIHNNHDAAEELASIFVERAISLKAHSEQSQYPHLFNGLELLSKLNELDLIQHTGLLE